MATYPPEKYVDPLDYEKAPSLSFRDAPIGTMYKAIITSRPKLVQSRDFESGELKTWPDGNPVMAVVIMLEMNGEARSLWAQRPSSMFAALVEAQKVAGAGPMEVGGTLYVKLVDEKPNSKNPRLNPAKQYACKYEPPTATQRDPFADVSAPPAASAVPSSATPTLSATTRQETW